MNVARQPGLMRRKTRWYLRTKVPVDLVAFLGRRQVWRSLRTGDHAVATKRLHRARAPLDQWFDQQHRRRDTGDRMNGEMPNLALRWFRESEHRAANADFDLTGDLLHETLGETEQELFELLNGGADEDVCAAVDRPAGIPWGRSRPAGR